MPATRILLAALFLAVLALAAASQPAAAAQAPAPGTPAAAPAEASALAMERAGAAVVTVGYVLEQESGEFAGIARREKLTTGGLLVRPSGIVLVGGEIFPEEGEGPLAPRLTGFEVRARGATFPARLAGRDEGRNLAFLQADGPGPFPSVSLEAGHVPALGEELLAVGRLPEDYDFAPVVRRFRVGAILPSGRWVLDGLVDVSLMAAPLLTADGRAVGVIGMDPYPEARDAEEEPEAFLILLASATKGRRLGFPVAVPAAEVLPLLDVPPPAAPDGKRAWIGVTLQSVPRDLAAHWGLPVPSGIAVTSVFPGSPADEAGLRVGDVLSSFDGRPVRAEREWELQPFIRRVQEAGIGREVPVLFYRKGKEREARLRLAEAPVTARLAGSYASEEFGLKVRELTFDWIQRANLDPGLRGVLVQELEPGGWAEVGGLEVADVVLRVGERPVEDLDAFRAALAEVKEKRLGEVVFFVRRGPETLFVPVRTDYGR